MTRRNLETARARLDIIAHPKNQGVYTYALDPDDLRVLLAAYDALEQQLRDWQDHLVRVHHVACDYPFRTDLPKDYDG